MTLIILVRHGETDWNRAGRIQGSSDIPLNDTGRQQARDAVATLATLAPQDTPLTIVASPLVRAKETAEIIASGLNVAEPVTYDGFRERHYGVAEGITDTELRAKWGSAQSADITDSEPWESVRSRGLSVIHELASTTRTRFAPNAGAILAVTHGAFIREMIRHATDGSLPASGHRIPNCSGHVLRVEPDRMTLLSTSSVAIAPR